MACLFYEQLNYPTEQNVLKVVEKFDSIDSGNSRSTALGRWNFKPPENIATVRDNAKDIHKPTIFGKLQELGLSKTLTWGSFHCNWLLHPWTEWGANDKQS